MAYRGASCRWIDRAIEVVGEWKANNFHLTHYPVANHKALNVVVFLSDPEPWSDQSNMVAEGTRDEVEAALCCGWHPIVLGLVRLLPEKLAT